MKHFLVALVLAATAATGLGGPALASNAATHAKFAVTYIDPGGPTTWVCSGTHLMNHGLGTRDKERCQVSGNLAAFVAGHYANDPSLGLTHCPDPLVDGLGGAGVVPAFGPTPTCWHSDSSTGATASSWDMTFTDNGTVPDTFTVTITAYYNQ